MLNNIYVNNFLLIKLINIYMIIFMEIMTIENIIKLFNI